MIFGEMMIELIAAGVKTQTRRPASSQARHVGRTYAVQRGRGKPGIARIEITDRRRQRLGEITTVDARAEGFDSRARFMEHWALLHGSVDPLAWVWAYTFKLVDDA